MELAAAHRPQLEDGRSDGFIEERLEMLIIGFIIGDYSRRLVKGRLNVPRGVDVIFSELSLCTKIR